MAPELVETLIDRSRPYDRFKADVFSLGLCVLYAITHRKFQSRDRRSMDPLLYKEIIGDWVKLANQILGQQ
jgi:hypothetical protein